MNKVTTINLNGNAYQLEEGGYDALRAYLEEAARRLAANPDVEEIIADIEQAIADKFRVGLGAHKTVVSVKEVAAVIAEMGPVEDSSEATGEETSGAGGARQEDEHTQNAASAGARAEGRGETEPGRNPQTGQHPGTGQGTAPQPGAARAQGAGPGPGNREGTAAPRRLFRIKDGAVFAGICNGLAAYCGIDVTLARILVVLLTFLTHGFGLLAYFVLIFVIPKAVTPEQKSAAWGPSPTAQDFIRRARAGYYEGMRTFGDRQAHRAWKRNFKREMRDWKRNFKREMREKAFPWSAMAGCDQPPRAGSWIGWGLFGVLSGLASVAALLSLALAVCLLATGAVFGLALPWGLPIWAGLLLLFIGYRIVTSPLRAMRRALYWTHGCGPGFCGPRAGVFDGLFLCAVLVLVLWLVGFHAHDVREVLAHLPHAVRQAAHDLREWWRGA